MASTPPASGLTTTASLGTLAHFPKELRLDLYELVAATDQPAREVNFHKFCKRGSVLSAVSRQIHIESKATVTQIKRGPCRHTDFTITLPSYADSSDRDHSLELLESQMPWGQQHVPKNIKSVRFLTAHLGRNVPLAVIVDFRSFSVAVYGAGAERTSIIEEEVTRVLRALEKNLESGQIALMRPSNAMGSKNDEIHISDLSAIAEKLRDLVCVDLDEWKSMMEWQDGEC